MQFDEGKTEMWGALIGPDFNKPGQYPETGILPREQEMVSHMPCLYSRITYLAEGRSRYA